MLELFFLFGIAVVSPLACVPSSCMLLLAKIGPWQAAMCVSSFLPYRQCYMYGCHLIGVDGSGGLLEWVIRHGILRYQFWNQLQFKVSICRHLW